MRPSLHHPDCLCGECTGLGAIVNPAPVQSNALLWVAIAVGAYFVLRDKNEESSPVVIPRTEAIAEHERLVGTLKSELKTQQAELEKYKAGNPSGAIKTERDERIWRVVKKKIKKERGYSSYDDFNDQDYGLAMTLFQKAKKKYEGKNLPKKYKLVSG